MNNSMTCETTFSTKKLLKTLVLLQIHIWQKRLLQTRKIFIYQFLKSGSTVSYKLAMRVQTLLNDLEKVKKKLGLYINYIIYIINYMRGSINSLISLVKKIPRKIIANRRRVLAIIFLSMYSIPGIVGAGSWSMSIYNENQMVISPVTGRKRPLLISWKFWKWGKKKKQTPPGLFPNFPNRTAPHRKYRRPPDREKELRDKKEAEEVAHMNAFSVMAEIEPGPYTLARARVIYLYSQGKSKRRYRIIDAIDTMRFMFIFNDYKHAKERAVFLVDWAYRGHKIWLCQRQMAKDAPYPPNFPYVMHLHIVEMVRIIGRHRGFNDYG